MDARMTEHPAATLQRRHVQRDQRRLIREALAECERECLAALSDYTARRRAALDKLDIRTKEIELQTMQRIERYRP